MRRRTIRTFLIGLLATGLVGCQTANRFAWWKHDNASEDTSRLARSAAPVLPSAQATPETLTASRQGGGQAPAYMASTKADPSSQRPVPAAALPPSAKSVPASSAATIFGAPAASYPNTSAAAAPPTTAASPAVSPTVMAQTSPYDPNAYQASQTAAVQTTAASTESGLDQNRYGESASKRYGMTDPAPAGTAASGLAAMPETSVAASSNAAADRYGLGGAVPGNNASAASASPSAGPEQDRYGLSTTPPAAPPQAVQATTAPPVVSTASVPVPAAPPSIAPSPPINSAPVSMATVQITSPPGQYRPGGTSSFQPYALPTQMEIASRASDASGTAAPSGSTMAPGVPAAPPAYPAGPSSSPSGTRAY